MVDHVPFSQSDVQVLYYRVTTCRSCRNNWVYIGVKTGKVFLCFVVIVRVRSIMLTSLFSLFYVTGGCHSFLHRG